MIYIQLYFGLLSYADANVRVTLLYTLLQELLTRHKSTVAEFLSKNYDWVNVAFIF